MAEDVTTDSQPYEHQILDERGAAERLLEMEAAAAEEAESSDAPEPDEAEPEEDLAEEEPAEEDFGEEPDESEFDEDQDEVSEEEPEADASQTFKVTVDGEPIEVDLKELKAGYSRHSDYTKKTMQLSEERKTLQQEREAVLAERQKYADGLTTLEQVLQPPEEPDWATLYKEDPDEAERIRAAYDARVEQFEAIKAEREKVQDTNLEEAREVQAQMLQEERKKLVLAIPEWQDPETFEKGRTRLAEYAESEYGYSAEDLNQVVDHRPIVLLRKAMLYDQMVEKGEAARSKAKKETDKTLKPGTSSSKRKKSKNRRVEAARKRFRESGDPRDGAALLLEMEKASSD